MIILSLLSIRPEKKDELPCIRLLYSLVSSKNRWIVAGYGQCWGIGGWLKGGWLEGVWLQGEWKQGGLINGVLLIIQKYSIEIQFWVNVRDSVDIHFNQGKTSHAFSTIEK